MYKITDGNAPEYIQSMFNKCDTIHSHETRSARNGNFIIPKMNSVKGQTAFVYSGAEVWNSLPLCIKEARSIEIFQERLKEHIFMIGDFLLLIDCISDAFLFSQFHVSFGLSSPFFYYKANFLFYNRFLHCH